MSLTSLALEILKIAETAATKEKALRAKYDKGIVDSLKHREYFRDERPLSDPLVARLSELQLIDLKNLHTLAKVGENPTWLSESRSLREVFENLEHNAPGNGDKQSYIRHFKSTIYNLPTFLTKALDLCQQMDIDPEKELTVS